MREPWRISWSPAAVWRLMQLPPSQAERVDRAVLQLARTHEGEFVRLASDHAVTARLHVPPFFVRMTLDRREGTICVWAIYQLPR